MLTAALRFISKEDGTDLKETSAKVVVPVLETAIPYITTRVLAVTLIFKLAKQELSKMKTTTHVTDEIFGDASTVVQQDKLTKSQQSP